MKRHQVFVPFSREHHQLLVLAQVLKSEVAAYRGMPDTPLEQARYAMDKYHTTLLPHIQREEDSLFPLLAGLHPEIDQLIYQLKDDHVELQEMFKKLEGEVNQTTLLDMIGHAIDSHVRMEERELFERCQELLSEEKLKEIQTSIESQSQ